LFQPSTWNAIPIALLAFFTFVNVIDNTDWRPMMPRELSSFLIAVSIILALSLFVPCIESIANALRRRAEREKTELVAETNPNERESAPGYSRNVA
jgi:hypothetical protein